MYTQFFKPAADRSLAILILVLFSPLWITISILSMAINGIPLLFKQTRTGLKGEPFIICKLRTLPVDAERSKNLSKVKLSPWNKFLRSSGLDEWPQLFNIIKGQMSFVGPRPLIPEYLERYSKHQYRRHEVLPGLTGLAQVRGRNTVEWQKRLELDVEYVNHQSFLLDLKILFKTPFVLLQKKGSEISEPFTGSN